MLSVEIDFMAMATQLKNWVVMAFAFGVWQIGVDSACGQASKIPPPLIGALGAEGFAAREKAQEELSGWALKQPSMAIPELRRQAEVAEDPEIRARCREVLKEVVIARDYRGEGYLGIAMQEVEVQVPGDSKPRRGVTVTLLMEGSAAALGGLRMGDVIVGIDDQVWWNAGMKDEFPVFIRKIRPRAVVEVKLLEGGKVVGRKVTLGEKPAGVNPSAIEDLEAANHAAKELFFRRWLDKQEAVPR